MCLLLWFIQAWGPALEPCLQKEIEFQDSDGHPDISYDQHIPKFAISILYLAQRILSYSFVKNNLDFPPTYHVLFLILHCSAVHLDSWQLFYRRLCLNIFLPKISGGFPSHSHTWVFVHSKIPWFSHVYLLIHAFRKWSCSLLCTDWIPQTCLFMWQPRDLKL